MTEKKTPYRSLRYFIAAIILVAVIACIVPFFIKGPDDRALLTPDQVKLPEIKLLKKEPVDTRFGADQKKGIADKKVKKVYKWRDKNGAWHFTDYPNPNGPSELILTEPDKPESEPAEKSKTDATAIDKKDAPASEPSFPLPISPTQVKKLKEDTEKIRKELERKYDEIHRLLGDENS
jgi:hypothetical protein